MSSRAKRKRKLQGSRVTGDTGSTSALWLPVPNPIPLPGSFQVAIFKACEVVGRKNVDLETALRYLKAAMWVEGMGRRLSNEAFVHLCCLAMIADEKGRIQATEEQAVEAAMILRPFIS